MPRILTILSVVLVTTSARAEDTLKIATFNCEFLTRPKVHIKFGLPFRMSDTSAAEQAQWDAAGFRDSKFSEAAEAVAGVLAPIDADVLALTEVGDEADVAEVRAKIAALGVNYPHVEVCDSADSFTQQHVAVLSKLPLTNVLDAIPGREMYDEELDDPETERDTGISKGMRVSLTAHGRAITLYILHLSSEGGGHEKDAQRIAQASLARRHYLPALEAGEHIIVAGDLNDARGEPAIRRIRGRDDIFGDLIQTGHTRYFADDALGTRWTYEFEGVRNQIDHILVSRSIYETCKSSKGIQASVIEHNNTLASDHRPLVVLLRFKDVP